ncbi:MAG: LacI family transcriptional regulator [Paracoccaceae bacterium]
MDDPKPTAESGVLLKPGERPTLKTISRITGLAVATVSRALLDAPDISAETKRRVHACADQVGYRPNRAGVRLRTGKTNVISLTLSTVHDLMSNTAKLLSSVASGLRGTPYHLVVTPFFADQDPLTPIKYIVETRSADAVILNQIEPRDPRIEYLRRMNFPFATHGRSEWADEHAYFDYDNAAFVEIGMRKLAARGRKSMLLVGPPLSQNYAQDMLVGMRRGSAKTGMSARLLEGVNSDNSAEDIEAAVIAYLVENPSIDVIICGSTTASLASATGAEALGRVIGQDIDIYSKEAIPLLRRFRKEFITVSEDVETAGRFLAKAALSQIEAPEAPPMQGLETPSFANWPLPDPKHPQTKIIAPKSRDLPL